MGEVVGPGDRAASSLNQDVAALQTSDARRMIESATTTPLVVATPK